MPNENGRPRFYKTPEEMQERIDLYFSECDEFKTKVLVKYKEGYDIVDFPSGKKYSVAGLAYYLGFSQRTQLADYAKDHPEFSDTIKRARLKIESQRIEDCVENDTKNAAGIKFDLINNFDYKDKLETTNNTTVTLPPQFKITDLGTMDNVKSIIENGI